MTDQEKSDYHRGRKHKSYELWAMGSEPSHNYTSDSMTEGYTLLLFSVHSVPQW